MTRMNYFGNHMLTWIASALYGTSSNDLCTGYWGFTKSAIARLKLNSMRFEIEAEMYASCKRGHQDQIDTNKLSSKDW